MTIQSEILNKKRSSVNKFRVRRVNERERYCAGDYAYNIKWWQYKTVEQSFARVERVREAIFQREGRESAFSINAEYWDRMTNIPSDGFLRRFFLLVLFLSLLIFWASIGGAFTAISFLGRASFYEHMQSHIQDSHFIYAWETEAFLQWQIYGVRRFFIAFFAIFPSSLVWKWQEEKFLHPLPIELFVKQFIWWNSVWIR